LPPRVLEFDYLGTEFVWTIAFSRGWSIQPELDLCPKCRNRPPPKLRRSP
jgi:hypothetical protein